MIRTHVGKAAFLFAAAALGASAAMVGCSHRSSSAEDVGAVTVALTLSPGVTVNTVSYTITGNGITAITGNIDVTNAAHATALVSGIPAGNTYLLTMNATSTDGKTTCTGSTNFNVIANQTASATVVLQCRGPKGNTGTVAISGRLDNCPFITGYSASALEATVGGSVSIATTASDFDAADTITYSWTASTTGIGTIASPGSASTTFNCTAPGSTSLSIAVSDGVCGDSLSNIIPITCLAPTTPTGGSGVGGSGVGGMGVGGMGVGGAGTGGSGMGGMMAACAESVSGDPVACCSCTTDNCSLAPNPAGTDGCSGISDPNDKALCQAAASCFAAATHPGNTVVPGHCTVSGDATKCFCGNSASACFATAGAANGPCVAQVQAAAKTMDPTLIRPLFTSPASPLGRAVNLMGCQGGLCSTECQVP
ncbi:MAG TPA: hypothetical protein VMU34_10140 [Mycobacterium sp.]|nr:hypothetical protein [Mycobacterium sp.]